MTPPLISADDTKAARIRQLEDEIVYVTDRLQETFDHAQVHALEGERNSLWKELERLRGLS